MRPRLLVKGLALMLSLGMLGWGFKVSGLHDLLDTGWIDSQVRGQGLSGDMVFLAVAIAGVAIGLPRQLICFLAGYAFGLGRGSGLALAASILGCAVCFFYARLLGRDLVMHRFSGRIARIDDFLRDNPLTMTILIRCLPVGSNLLTNLLAGVSSVPAGRFLAGSLIGYLPQTVIFVLLGSGIHVAPMLRISLSVVLFLLSAVLGVFLYRRLRHGHSLGEELD
ncbi:MAG TPA: TVP38/TMEM64 family protein [Rhodospirillaceae bacterium]|nr:TVP38/TMEM64 family protein [Rhodospirillaceae bacterium]